MKTLKLPKIIALVLTLLIASCEKDDNDLFQDKQPIELIADNNWLEDEISEVETRWYKVSGEAIFNTLFVEWAELENHGESRSYSADIKVSAYMLDGETPYFEEKNNGYGGSIKTVSLENEIDILLKVELNDPTKPGTFAIRATGTGTVEVDYIDLSLGDNWTQSSIESDEIIGYKVDCGQAKKIAIVWAEADSPENGYTAEIKGSVFHKDGETIYKDLEGGKDILNKNKSHSDDPKIIEVNQDDKAIKIRIEVNSFPGTFAIKVIEITE